MMMLLMSLVFSVHAPVCRLLPTRWHGVKRQVCNSYGKSCQLHDRADSVGRTGH